MRLTDKSRWRYDEKWRGRAAIDGARAREEWLGALGKLLPRGGQRYLELGCAPGIYTAALAEGTDWKVSGIDYSEESQLFVENLKLVNKQARLLHADMFESRLTEQFDIVCSFGLVEHFRGRSLEELFELHDSYVAQGGLVVIEMPNFTGFQYVWHYIFDRPDLDRHNVDVMQPQSLSWFSDHGYEVLHNNYVGAMRLWGNSGWLRFRLAGKAAAAVAVASSIIVRRLDQWGIRLFRGRTWSPSLLMVARKIGPAGEQKRVA